MYDHPELVVYTTSIGYSFELPAIVPHPKVKYICFSDRPLKIKSNWEEFLIDPLLKDDLFRSSREPKMLTHKFLHNYENSLYIDSRVHLKRNPLELWQHLIPNSNTIFGGFYHTKRITLIDEFEAVLRQKLDFASTVKAQFCYYKKNHLDILYSKPVWGGLIARKHNERRCQDAMRFWYSHVLRYSRRDQLSLPIALENFNREHVNLISGSIHTSDFHDWPVGSSVKPSYYRVDT